MTTEDLAGRVRAALESADLGSIAELLAPDAHWGAPDAPPEDGCQNRGEVIAWWGGARSAGARATVTEVTPGEGTLLVGLKLAGTQAASEAGGERERWQVLTVRDGLVSDIRGFEDRQTAAARAGVPA